MINVFILELAVIILTICLGFWMKKQKYTHVTLKMFILFMGVLLFEIMSEPMWRNYSLDAWAYIYHDVSWIITLGWVNIFLVSIILIDTFFKYEEKKKFWLYLVLITLITTPIEVFLLSNGVRGYAVELTNSMSGIHIPFTSAPIEIIVVVLMIAALIIPFYKIMSGLFSLRTK